MIYFTLIPRPNDIDIKFVIPHRVEITYVIIKRPRKGQSKSVDVKFQNKVFSSAKTPHSGLGGNEKYA